MKNISEFGYEEEVLFPSGSYFLVKAIKKNQKTGKIEKIFLEIHIPSEKSEFHLFQDKKNKFGRL